MNLSILQATLRKKLRLFFSWQIFTKRLILMKTSVACAIVPSVNCLPHYFFIPKPIFVIQLDSIPMTKQFKIPFFSRLRSKNFQINFIISYSGRAFQQCQEHAQNSFIIFSFDLNHFPIKNWSIFNIFSFKTL